jgi:hypothetical protein
MEPDRSLPSGNLRPQTLQIRIAAFGGIGVSGAVIETLLYSAV